jgi:hypothetical protein
MTVLPCVTMTQDVHVRHRSDWSQFPRHAQVKSANEQTPDKCKLVHQPKDQIFTPSSRETSSTIPVWLHHLGGLDAHLSGGVSFK